MNENVICETKPFIVIIFKASHCSKLFINSTLSTFHIQFHVSLASIVVSELENRDKPSPPPVFDFTAQHNLAESSTRQPIYLCITKNNYKHPLKTQSYTFPQTMTQIH